jgi:hypothetical protein
VQSEERRDDLGASLVRLPRARETGAPDPVRRSVATATAHAKVPVVVAAAMTGHSLQVYDTHYAKPFRDTEERERVRKSLASIGFGNARVFFDGAYRDRTGDLRLAKPALSQLS